MKLKIFAVLFTAFFFLLSKPTLGQQFFRIKAEFSIKETLVDGKSSLLMGTVYFDKTRKQIIYSIKFPEPEFLVVTDSFVYTIKEGKIQEKKQGVGLMQFSIFNLALSSKLSNYGLDQSPLFKLTNVEKEDSLIISTWEPTLDKLKELTGTILISQVHKRLFGLVFFDKNKKLMSKQFFEEYKNFSGLQFPGQITQINYIGGKEYYKITTFKNVIVNDTNENTFYNYNIPAQ